MAALMANAVLAALEGLVAVFAFVLSRWAAGAFGTVDGYRRYLSCFNCEDGHEMLLPQKQRR